MRVGAEMRQHIKELWERADVEELESLNFEGVVKQVCKEFAYPVQVEFTEDIVRCFTEDELELV